MKRRITALMLSITSFAIILTISMSVLIVYKTMRREVFGEIRMQAELMNILGLDHIAESINSIDEDSSRITLIDIGGTVLADSEADVAKLDNHLNRIEVQDALKNGEGVAVRHSSTMGYDTFYYALRLDNGQVLRVSRESRSVWSIVWSIVPVAVLISILMIFLCLVISQLLIRRILAPIEYMASNLGKSNPKSVYRELAPFVDMINVQHEDILRNVNIRQEFTANVSHELKTPLAAISGYAELIESGMAKDEDAKRFAHDIHNNSERLLTLINDIIRLSELDETTSTEITYSETNIYEVAKNCIEMLAISADKSEVTLTLSGDSEAGAMVNKDLIEEMIYNLIDNGIRYNVPKGNVTILVCKSSDDRYSVEIKITDTGIGIPLEHQDRIFERFYRVDKSRSKASGGTGLGLAIVKHIVSVHNAQISLSSEVNKGTEITVYIR